MSHDPYFLYTDEPLDAYPAARAVCRVDLVESKLAAAGYRYNRRTPLPGFIMQLRGQTNWRAVKPDGSMGFQRWPAKNDAAYDLLSPEQREHTIRGVNR